MQVFYWHLESKKCQNYAFLVQEYKRFTDLCILTKRSSAKCAQRDCAARCG